MRIFITGGHGFIGSFLIKKLLSLGYEVFNFERYKPTYGLPREVTTYYGDITYYHSIQRAIELVKPNIVIHLAAISTADIFAYENWEEMLDIIIKGTANVAEASRRTLSNLELFILTSSCNVYGLQEIFPITEEAGTNPTDPYNVGKIGAENYIQFLIKTYNFPAIILRPFPTYGTILRRNIIEKTIRQMLLREEEIKLGNPESIRDFLWIEDHINGYIQCIKHLEQIGETFNLCTSEEISIKDLVYKIRQLVGHYAYGYDGIITWNSVPKRPNDIPKLVGSYEKAKRLLSWKPSVYLDKGLETIIMTFLSEMMETGTY